MDTFDLFAPTETELLILSYGAGQDSTAILEKKISGELDKEYPHKRFLMVMSDTGDEHEATYEHVERTKARCEEHGLEFVFITADMGYHGDTWQSLRDQYRINRTVGSKAFKKTCTDNLKIQPIYRFLTDWLRTNYQACSAYESKAKVFDAFNAAHGKIKMVIGIAAGEETRVSTTKAKTDEPAYRTRNVDKVYPLIDWGMNRQACQDYIRAQGQIVPPPSNCILCPWVSEEELEYIRRFHPEDLAEWIELEAAKLERFKHKENTQVICKDTGNVKIVNKNVGVWGSLKYLPQKVAEVKEKFKDWSDERLEEYKFSHGHCVKAVY